MSQIIDIGADVLAIKMKKQNILMQIVKECIDIYTKISLEGLFCEEVFTR